MQVIWKQRSNIFPSINQLIDYYLKSGLPIIRRYIKHLKFIEYFLLPIFSKSLWRWLFCVFQLLTFYVDCFLETFIKRANKNLIFLNSFLTFPWGWKCECVLRFPGRNIEEIVGNVSLSDKRRHSNVCGVFPTGLWSSKIFY